MKISELIAILYHLQGRVGDADVRYVSTDTYYPPQAVTKVEAAFDDGSHDRHGDAAPTGAPFVLVR
jgi:hypothetical protein